MIYNHDDYGLWVTVSSSSNIFKVVLAEVLRAKCLCPLSEASAQIKRLHRMARGTFIAKELDNISTDISILTGVLANIDFFRRYKLPPLYPRFAAEVSTCANGFIETAMQSAGMVLRVQFCLRSS